MSKVLITALYPTVEKALSDKNNEAKIKEMVSSYLDRNMEKLTTSGPIYRTIFSDSDMKKLYEATNLDPLEIKRIIKTSSAIKAGWQIMNNPFNTAIALSIRYYKIKKNDTMTNLLLIYLCLSMYPSLHFKYFKYEPNENIMNYTINNLSNKFKIKKQGTFYHAMLDTVQVSDKTYTSNIVRGTDKDIVDYIQAVKTRLNSLLRKLSNEFYDNEKSGKYMNLEVDNFDEDNYREANSNSYIIDNITNKVVMDLIVQGPNTRLIDLSAKICKVSVSELRNYLNTMVDSDNKEEIRSIIESILFLYLFDDKNKVEELNSNKFLMYCLELYKKANTSDTNIIKIKNVLDKWLERLDIYKKTQRVATINDFRRALFIFFVLTIEYGNYK